MAPPSSSRSDHPTARAHDTPAAALPPWQLQTIELFVRAADLLGLPKSTGGVYGLIYSTEEPLPLDVIMTRLQISKGSTSQALTTLKRLKAIKPVFIPGDRRDHYVPETQLRRLVSGFLHDQVVPHLESGRERLAFIENQAAADHPVSPKLKQRLKRLQSWRSQSEKLIPLITRFLGNH